MSDQSSGAASIIRLRYVVDGTSAVQEVQRTGKEITDQANRTGAEVERATGRTEAAVESMGRATAETGRRTSEAFRGAGAAISATTAALVSAGAQSAGPIATMASSLASLAANGVGGLALLSAGVVGLVQGIRGLSAEQERATRTSDAMTAALQRQAEGIRQLEDARSRAVGAATGMGAEPVAVQLQLREAEARLANLRFESSYAGGEVGLRSIDQQIQDAAEEVASLRQQLRTIEQRDALLRAADRESPEEALRRMEAGDRRLEDFIRRTFPDRGPGGSALDAAIGSMSTDPFGSFSGGEVARLRAERDELTRRLEAEAMGGMSFGREGGPAASREVYSIDAALRRRLDAARELRAITEDRQESELRLEEEIADKVRELAEYRRMGEAADSAVIAAREEEIRALEETLDLEQRIGAEREARARPEQSAAGGRGPAAIGADFSGGAITGRFALDVEQATRSGLANALNNTDDLRGALSSFAMGLRQSATEALVDALISAVTGGKGIAQSLFQALAPAAAGAAGGAAGSGAAPAAATAASAAGAARSMQVQPIVVVNVLDERAADGVAAKMSSSGAQVVVSRAGSGAGASAGVIPGRRR